MVISPENLPTIKDEGWKYTDIRKAMPAGLTSIDDDAVVIHSGCGQNGGYQRDILLTGRDKFQHNQNIEILVKEGESLIVVEVHEGQGKYWKNINKTIVLEDGADLIHYIFQNDVEKSVNTSFTTIKLNKNSSYCQFSLNTGGGLCRNEINAKILGEYVSCDINGVTLVGGSSVADTTVTIEHIKPQCKSSQNFRYIVADKGRGVFQANTVIRKNACKTDASQFCKSLLLSEMAEMDTKPELTISEDDVKCTHGYASGQIDGQALFYLQSRGIPQTTACLLLQESFISEIIGKIKDATIRERASKTAADWLKKKG